MKSETIEAIQGAIEADEEMQGYFKAYDDIDNLKWDLPAGWDVQDFIRKRVSTDGHDALRSLANLFDTHNPKWEIMPRGEAERDRAEEKERWLEWHMKRANQIGEKSPFRKALHNAGKYNRVILQVDYLPYWLPEKEKNWSKEQKAASDAGPFCIEVKNPRNVYYEMGKYGLKWVANVSLMYGQEIINHWSAYAPEDAKKDEEKKIKSAISKLEKELENDSECKYIYVDYTSHDKREVAAFKCPSLASFENLESDAEHITIVDSENKLSFINWVVVSGDSDPLLHSMHVGGSWENQNLIDTIVDSTVLMRAFAPVLKHTSTVGTPLVVAFDGTTPVIELKQGETADAIMLPPIDSALTQLAGINAGRIAQSTSIQKLAGMDMVGNVQYSTMNAYIQLQMTALEPYKRTTEKAWEQAALIMFKWLKETGDTVVGYREKVSKPGQTEGDAIMMEPDDFDTEDLFISCELIANTPTDKMQLVNMYSALKREGAQIGWGELLERLGMGVPEVLKQDYITEQLEQISLSNFVEELKAQLQMKIQAQTMQMQSELQMQQQQQQAELQKEQAAQQAELDAQTAQAEQSPAPQGAPQGMMPQSMGASMGASGDTVMPGGPMNDTSQGGMSTMQSAPGMTRNQVAQ